MSDWVVDDEPAAKTGGSDWVVDDDAKAASDWDTGEGLLSATPRRPAEPAVPDPTIADAAGNWVRDSFGNLINTVKSGAGAIATAARHPIDTLTDSSRRHEFERGMGDVVTLGLANKIANAVSPEFAATEEGDAAQAPGFRAAGNLLGAAVPNPVSKILGNAGRTLPGKVAPAVVNYEAQAVPTAFATAPPGQRVSTALEAAVDPASLVTAVGLHNAAPTAEAAAKIAADKTRDIVEPAMPALTKTVAERQWKEIQKEAGEGDGLGPSATPTAKKQFARDKEDITRVVMQDPQVFSAIRKAPEKGLPVILDRANKVGSQLEPLYSGVIDKALPTTQGEYIDHLEREAKPLLKTVDPEETRIGQGLLKEAARLKAGWAAEDVPQLSPQEQINVNTLTKARDNYAKRGDTENAAAADAEIKKISDAAPQEQVYNPKKVVPLWQIRKSVTALQDGAFDAEGGIRGPDVTKRNAKIASVAKQFVDNQFDKATEILGNSDTTDKIKSLNSDYSALMGLKKVLAQRMERSGQTPLMKKMLHVASVQNVAMAAMGSAAGGVGGHALLPAAIGAAAPIAVHLGMRAANHQANLFLAKAVTFLQKGDAANAIRAAQAAAKAGAGPGLVQKIISQANAAGEARRGPPSMNEALGSLNVTGPNVHP